MPSFKRFRKVDYSDPSWVATIGQGRLGLRGRGFVVQDGGGNLNGFRSAPPAGSDAAPAPVSAEPPAVPAKESDRREVLRVQGTSRFHREV
jgi:hypothetical protein